MNDSYLYLTKGQKCSLSPGKMSEHHFWLLIEISPLHSEKVINALRDFLVLGYTRREACERHDVSQGYFSGALGRFQRVNQTVTRLVPFYISETSIPYMG
ncbi:TPA: adhesin biosynthesis transcription regulatory family protein [Raoultella planticola]